MRASRTETGLALENVILPCVFLLFSLSIDFFLEGLPMIDGGGDVTQDKMLRCHLPGVVYHQVYNVY